MNKIITFNVLKGEDGFYVASSDTLSIVTQGKTFEELLVNVREAVEISLDESIEGKKATFPPVMMNMDFSEIAHA